MGSPASRSSGTSVEVRVKTTWCVTLLCAAAVSCSGGGGTKSGAGKEARPAVVRDDTLLEGTGIGGLRIDQATIAEMQRTYGKSEPSTFSTASALEFRRPPLAFWFLKPVEGDGPPRLYAVRTLLWDDCYRGQTSKGIGILAPALYATARAATGKDPNEAPDSPVVTAIMVVRPFNVLEGATTAMAGQQVISTRPKTDLLISE